MYSTSQSNMNVISLSGGRSKQRRQRHSIAVFNHNNNNNNEWKPFESPQPRLTVDSSQINVDKQLCVLRRLFTDGDQLTVRDMELLRLACKERVDAAGGDTQQRLVELKYALNVIDEIPLECEDVQWLLQYQYLLNWCHLSVCFLVLPRERGALFSDTKNKYRLILSKLSRLPPHDPDRLLAMLHWAQLCYEYAEHCDDESLQWCSDAVRSAQLKLTGTDGVNKRFDRFRKERRRR